MGCGKSSVARELGERMGLPVIDLDREIERITNRTIPEIFGSDGEPGFREVEFKVLKDTLMLDEGVLATGGGSPCYNDSLKMLLNWGDVVFLDVPFDVLENRVSDGSGRPNWSSDAEQLYLKRLPIYRQANISIDARGSIEEVTSAIVRRLS